jgi:hypothetical protein
MTDGIVIVNVPRGWLRKWKPQGFRFCMESWLLMSDYTQLALNEFNNLAGDRFMLIAIMMAGKAYNHFEKGKPWRYTEAQVNDWLNAMPRGDYERLVKTMLDSQIGGKPLRDIAGVEEDGEKKK